MNSITFIQTIYHLSSLFKNKTVVTAVPAPVGSTEDNEAAIKQWKDQVLRLQEEVTSLKVVSSIKQLKFLSGKLSQCCHP